MDEAETQEQDVWAVAAELEKASSITRSVRPIDP
jgi:hypothetical protein